MIDLLFFTLKCDKTHTLFYSANIRFYTNICKYIAEKSEIHIDIQTIFYFNKL